MPHVPPWARRLQCKDPRIVNKYNEFLLRILQEQHLPEKIMALSDKLQKLMDLRRSYQNELNSVN